MIKSRRKLILLITFLLLSFSCCAITHRYDQYIGRVVDADTKQPLEGAAVLVVYNTQHWGLAGSVTHYADAKETVTDKNGEFRIPSIRLYTFQVMAGWEGHPRVTIFKPGYGCYPWHKYAAPKFDYGSLPPNQYVSIELPMLATKEERLENESCFPASVPNNKMKNMIKLNNIERKELTLDPTHLKE